MLLQLDEYRSISNTARFDVDTKLARRIQGEGLDLEALRSMNLKLKTSFGSYLALARPQCIAAIAR